MLKHDDVQDDVIILEKTLCIETVCYKYANNRNK